jgi:hypothetical protein
VTLQQVAVAAASSRPANVRLYALVNGSGGPRALRVELGDEPARLLHQAVVRATRHMADLTQIAYGPVVLCPGGHCLVLPNADSPRLAAVTAAVASHPTTRFDPTSQTAAGLFALATELQLPGGRTVIGYRAQRPARALGRSKSVALLYRDGRFDQLNPLEVLQLDFAFDVITAEDTAYFEKKRTFEKLFDHLAPLAAAARATFRAVTANLRVEGLAEMESACTTDANMMAKMASIARSMQADAAYATALTMTNLLRFIDQHQQYGIKTTGSGNRRRLVFESVPTERYKILHLLDDDYLHSQLTQRSYESGSKIPTP